MVIEDDRFPLGLKVLVVDDDTICLKLIENLLVKCHYKVTTTNKPKEALRMLRENKRRFDIVISDVEMPGMDGIRLLQLVGLEMDIPVIMLSAYSDIKRVMQGVRNGACDYLVKPVRIQELQNIWQHVMRKNSLQTGSDVAGGSASPTGKNNASKAVKHDNKGKAIKETSADDNNDGDDDDDDDDDEGEQDIDDPITPKKPRLFWSVELHQKFVDAVNLLGLDKAFPKKILDIMDVEGLTREKVASHLQKYRLYLRKVNNGTNQPGTGLSSLGVEDPHIASLGGGYGVYRSLAGPGRFPGVGSLLDQTAAMRLNTGSGLSLTGLSSSPMLQTPQLPTSNSTFSKFDSLSSPAFQNTNNTMFQGISPTTMQMNKTSSCQPNTSMMLDGTTPPLNSRNFSNNSSSLISPSPNTGAFGFGSTTPNLLDLSSRPNWQAATQPLPLTQNVIPSSGAMAPAIPQIQNEPLDIFSGINQHPHIWQNHVPNGGNNSSTLSSQINAVAPTPAENVRFNSNMMGAPPFNPLEGASSQMMQQNEVQKSNDNASLLRFDENFLLDDPKLLCGAGQTSEEYLEDIVGRFFQQGNGETSRAQNDPGLDPFLMQ